MHTGGIVLKIGEKIRNAREDLDLSQEEVSAQIPMNQSSYSKIERDIQEPNLEQFKRICQILNLSPSYLLNLRGYDESAMNDIKFAKDVKRAYERIYK